MTDVVDAATRSRMMAGIRGRDTGIELQVRRALFALGWRYRLHARTLPGRPDLVFPKRQAVIFVHGCFWHGHDCALFRMPATRPQFWRAKIGDNQRRDALCAERLLAARWRVMTVWECALRGRSDRQFLQVIARVDRWLRGSRRLGEIRG
jgi:DNA mismatch endonuclease, patch repair protein